MSGQNDSGSEGARSVPPTEVAPLTPVRLSEDVEVVVISIPSPGVYPQLTAAEHHVACLVLDGLSDREIAKVRGTSIRTVANQLQTIYDKLRVSSRVELAAMMQGRATSR